MKYYVMKGKECKGVAVKMGNEYWIHFYDSYLTHTYTLKELKAKRFKLVAQ